MVFHEMRYTLQLEQFQDKEELHTNKETGCMDCSSLTDLREGSTKL